MITPRYFTESTHLAANRVIFKLTGGERFLEIHSASHLVGFKATDLPSVTPGGYHIIKKVAMNRILKSPDTVI